VVAWRRVQSEVHSPAIEGDGGRGWGLTFCALAGWMHMKELLVRHRFQVQPDFTIGHHQEVHSRAIFSMPNVVY
jgi:hypothetical protein